MKKNVKKLLYYNFLRRDKILVKNVKEHGTKNKDIIEIRNLKN